eukprot:gene22864-24157_t
MNVRIALLLLAIVIAATFFTAWTLTSDTTIAWLHLLGLGLSLALLAVLFWGRVEFEPTR